MIRIDGYPIDLVVTKDASWPGEVTEHSVDADADITDHIRNGSMDLTLACIVSDTPIGAVELERPAGVVLHGQAALDKMLEIRGRKRPVTIETPRRTYDRMGMTSLQENESAESSGGVLFTVSFKQLNILANKRIKVNAAPIAKGNAQLGNKQPLFANGAAVEGVIYVVAYPVAERARRTKTYGPPKATNVRAASVNVGFATVVPTAAMDCYEIRAEYATGYLKKRGKGDTGGTAGAYDYIPFLSTKEKFSGERTDALGRSVTRSPVTEEQRDELTAGQRWFQQPEAQPVAKVRK